MAVKKFIQGFLILCLMLILAGIDGKSSSAENNSVLRTISNDYVEFYTLGNGRYTIGTVLGNPDIDTDNYKKMLFGHPGGDTSYTTISLDGKAQIFSAKQVEYYAEEQKSESVNTYNGIKVIQTLSIVENENTGREDMIKINYQIKNDSDSDKKVDYEDSSDIVQLIVTGDMDIDFYKQGVLKYYYHPNEEYGIQDSPDFLAQHAGYYGNQQVNTISFVRDDYTIQLTSHENQSSQIGVLDNGKLKSLSDYEWKKGDIIAIDYCMDGAEICHNGQQIYFDGERSDGTLPETTPLPEITPTPDTTLTPEETSSPNMPISSGNISVMSMDTGREITSNTIAARIKIKNNGEESIPINKLTLGYIFDPDGMPFHIAEFDWACNNHNGITETAKGRFISLNSGEMQLNISFDCNQYLEVGHELEVHFRIHTPEWKNYDLGNDYSRNAWDYTETDRIFVYEGDKLISGRRSADG